MTATIIVSCEELASSLVSIEEDQYRHLFRARRLALGDSIRLVDGHGQARLGRISSVDRRVATVSVGEPAPSLEPSMALTLCVAVPKGDRASWLVEKVTEAGVVAIEFVEFARSIRSPSEAQIERLRRVARSAVEQCGRALLPEVREPRKLERVVADLRGHGLLLDPKGREQSLREAAVASNELSVFVGPEGGLEAVERELLLSNGLYPVNLGERTFRTETAAVLAIGALLL